MPARRALPLLLVLILAASSVAAQDSDSRPLQGQRVLEDRPLPTPERALQDLWFQRKTALDVDDLSRAATLIDEMTSVIRSEHLGRVPWLARGFAFEGYENLREGNYERSREAFDLARGFDPKLPEAQTGYAWAALYAGRGFGTFTTEYRKALLLRWESFRKEGRANLILMALIAISLLGAVIVILLLLRYGKMLRHDVAERTPGAWSQGASRLAGWVVLLLPLLLWLSGVWILLWWTLLIARYMTGREKAAAAIFCVAVLLSGPLAASSTAQAISSSNPVLLAVEEALEGGFGNEVIGRLQESLDQRPQAHELRLLLGNTYERAGLYREAFEEYQRILQSRPDDARALNDIGNLYLRTGQVNQAVVFYTRASESNPDAALIYHNLALAQNEALRMNDSEGSLSRLQQLDPELARRLVTARGLGETVKPITAYASRERVWTQVPAASTGSHMFSMDHFTAPVSTGAIGVLALLAWFSMGRAPNRAQICIRCGEAFCGRCKKELGARDCCAQCIHLFIKKEAIEPEARSRKMHQVDRFSRSSRFRIRAASLLLPGAGHMLAGRTFTGILLLAAWLSPMAALVLNRWLILSPSLPVLDLPGLTTVIPAVFMILLWSAANLSVSRAGTA